MLFNQDAVRSLSPWWKSDGEESWAGMSINTINSNALDEDLQQNNGFGSRANLEAEDFTQSDVYLDCMKDVEKTDDELTPIPPAMPESQTWNIEAKQFLHSGQHVDPHQLHPLGPEIHEPPPNQQEPEAVDGNLKPPPNNPSDQEEVDPHSSINQLDQDLANRSAFAALTALAAVVRRQAPNPGRSNIKGKGNHHQAPHRVIYLYDLTPQDIILGRGGGSNPKKSEGNRRWLIVIVPVWALRYRTLPNKAKSPFSEEMIRWLRSENYRFVEPTKDSAGQKCWIEVRHEDARIYNKVMHACRDCISPSIAAIDSAAAV
ncbi:unnamed protein product [Cylindrotheca closterium]|uniref:DUF6824 domain-containing protein n=1 Tax=Cylindrotheca closterium TaxID=2856 RepID=A0AAD2GB62_9STRA|nr:unnamed protein product [Cylindrotheca closterium]